MAQTTANVAAQTSSTRPKVCLVLSGGGARGLAHVGILKFLEQAKIPIDCIAGTSMGAVVGGLYASGLTAQQVEERLVSLDWAEIRANRAGRQFQDPRRREDDYEMNVPLEVRIKGGSVQLPQGLIQARLFESKLKEWLQPVAGIQNFDRLPIPFRAVATRLGTGEKVVLASGKLNDVLRASMSVPGLFAPHKIDDAAYVDGGLVENLPIQTAREMGADVVIAVNVGTPLLAENDIQSFLDVSMQMLQILTERNVKEQIKTLGARDIEISPSLGEFGFMDFLRYEPIITRGEHAARSANTALAPLAVSTELYEQKNRQKLAAIKASLVETAAREASQVRPPASPDNNDASAVSRVNLSSAEHRLRAGISLGTDLNTGYFRLNFGHEAIYGEAGLRWRNAIEVGRLQKLSSELLSSTTIDSNWFFAPRLEITRRQFPLYIGASKISDVVAQRAQIGLDAGLIDRQWGELRLGAIVDRSSTGLQSAALFDVSTGNVVPVPNVISSTAGGRLRYAYDSLDSALLPRSGWRGAIEFQRGFAIDTSNRSFTLASFEVTHAKSFGNNVLELHASGGAYSTGSTISPQLFSLGGFHRLSGFDQDRFVGRTAALGRVVWRHYAGTANALGYNQYVGVSLEVGRVGNPLALLPSNPVNTHTSASLFWALETPLGPFYTAIGLPRGESPRIYIFLGRP